MSVTCLISGADKAGKTSLGLTFPKPLRHFDLDVGGFRRAKHRFQAEIDSGQIVSASYYMPQQSVTTKLGMGASKTIVGIKELWYKMLSDYLDALRDPNVATVMFDSWVQVWELCRLAYLQEKQGANPNRGGLMQIEYVEPNARMRAMLTAAKELDKNLVLTAFMTDSYEKRQTPDGNIVDIVVGKEAAGWKRIDQFSDVNISNEIKSVAVDGSKMFKVYSKITLCGLALQATGFEMPDATWANLHDVIVAFRGSEI